MANLEGEHPFILPGSEELDTLTQIRKQLSPKGQDVLDAYSSTFLEKDVYESYLNDPLKRAGLRRSLMGQLKNPHEIRTIIDALGLGPNHNEPHPKSDPE